MRIITTISGWEDACRDYGCVVTREKPVQIHHVFGRTYRHNKELIGPYYILPLTPRLHDSRSNSEYNVTHFRKRFAREYGYQKDLFLEMVERMREQGIESPIDPIKMAAIIDSPLR